jgi:hypothetical protein
MPAYDQCHDQVIRALQKEGWNINRQQVKLPFDERRLYIDLKASRGLNGRRQTILLVEVKCFPDEKTFLADLYTAIGQYILYRTILDSNGVSFPLYLSIPQSVFVTQFNQIIRDACRQHQIKLVIINLDSEEVMEWIA